MFPVMCRKDGLRVRCLLMGDLDLVTIGWAYLGRVTLILGTTALTTGLTTVIDTGLDGGAVLFEKRGKLSPCYIGPFKILAKVGPVAYTLELPEELKGIHSTFHVLNLKKCLGKGDIVVPVDEIQLDDKLYMIEELVEVVDREVKRLNQNRIPIVKVRWNSQRGLEFT
nr:putative reverse transcriptase domain-containing protein [Tanacetum cinerariifolium]